MTEILRVSRDTYHWYTLLSTYCTYLHTHVQAVQNRSSCQQEVGDCRSELNAHANFENFGSAMVTLVRLATNDNWAALQSVRHNNSEQTTTARGLISLDL